MRVCLNCKTSFHLRVVIGGKTRTLANRKFCLTCSPFGQHNTSKVAPCTSDNMSTCIRCGRVYQYDRSKGHTRTRCNSCIKKKYPQSVEKVVPRKVVSGTQRDTLKSECIRLRREERLSYREIVKRTGARRGTLATWLLGMPLSEEEQNASRAAASLESREARQADWEVRNKVWVAQAQTAKQEGMYVTYRKGQVAMLKVQLRANELGATVSLPTVEGRYDLIVDLQGRLYRAQVKYAGAVTKNGARGSVHLSLRKDTRGNKRTKLYRKEEVDVLLVYLPKIDEVLWIDPEFFLIERIR